MLSTYVFEHTLPCSHKLYEYMLPPHTKKHTYCSFLMHENTLLKVMIQKILNTFLTWVNKLEAWHKGWTTRNQLCVGGHLLVLICSKYRYQFHKQGHLSSGNMQMRKQMQTAVNLQISALLC